ncbi:MAG: dihydrolipoyllysine-residue succinyltransferase [Actinomycetota bacterium]|jgi:pyruvate dehydrogenase E2 component (dihydrolipoamide acetyltransferase)
MSFKYPVVMPKMSMTMETGELLLFHVKVGDQVKSGDVLFEVMTDKIDMEVEAPADGVIEALVGTPGDVIEIGKPVLIMLTETEVMAFDFGGDAAPAAPVTEPVVAAPVAEPVVVVPAPVAAPVAPVAAPVVAAPVVEQVAVPVVTAPIIVNTSVKAVPKARVEAANRGIDLRTVHPTGPDRTITMSDVNSAQIDPAILKRQAANKALIAKGIEMTRGIAQASFNRRSNANFDHAQLISAWAKILRGRPDLAAHQHVGVSLIIESKYGSALPVFRDPDLINVDQLRTLVTSTSDAAKNGKVPIAMLSGGTTTIFDLTSYSMSSATPLLFPNQVTSLTIGYDSESTKNISLTIDLNFCDFYDGALLLDALIASL